MDLSHHFLVSMPQMQDSCFRDTVVYVLDHGENGAFGVIINDALGLQFESLLKQVDITLTDESASNTAVLRGGPVDEGHGLVLHEPGHSYGTTHDFNHDVSLSSSKDVLEAISWRWQTTPGLPVKLTMNFCLLRHCTNAVRL